MTRSSVEAPARAAASPLVSFSGVGVVFGSTGGHGAVRALEDVTLALAEGEFVSLVGPSGCGKSTLLRIAADLLAPTTGTVEVAGQSPRAARLRRDIGFVFQDSALLEWRSIIDNVMLPLELKGVSLVERRERAGDLIRLVGLSGFERAFPRQLSGGMRQRASIARAMSTAPKVLLMDEPFGALDQITRDRLNMELLELSQRQRMTVLFVTHSIREAVLLSDRVVVMSPRPGRIRQVLDIDLARPRHLAVRNDARFIALAQQGLAELEGGFGDHG
ncbi:ABC transporter ATP-binding protein [Labrys wisconsinensis]|uniref:NitT/TauT family transport system ATP-binding protein n=1 Tax=Labrys wisconsinensis TaxID=425677 RepID=A0ABU0J370_9HYPH|nr:ABC transporter ATP-binding protein [Labrys wisconsinensis]MDQ0468710.1 NitT/TauT family transport system ATP-binding protein [Labrys wisconsinensis]